MGDGFRIIAIGACGCYMIFFIIGMCTWLIGCNKDVDGGCLTRDVYNSTYSEKYIETDQCSECTHWCVNQFLLPLISTGARQRVEAHAARAGSGNQLATLG